MIDTSKLQAALSSSKEDKKGVIYLNTQFGTIKVFQNSKYFNSLANLIKENPEVNINIQTVSIRSNMETNDTSFEFDIVK